MKNKFLIFFIFFSIFCLISSCVVTPSSGQREISLISQEEEKSIGKKEHPKIIKQFGYVLNDYHVVRDTVKRGDSFGTILEKNNLFYPQIYNIVQKVKRVYDIRKINIGKPYTILFSKDSLRKP